MKRLLLAIVLAASCRADTITSTFCDADGAQASGPLSCSITSGFGSIATASAGPATAVLYGTTFSVNETIFGFTKVPYIFGQPTSALDTASVEYSDTLETPGVSRLGYLKLTWVPVAGDGYSESFNSTVQVGSFVLSEHGNGYFGYFCCSILFPVEIGGPVSFDLSLNTRNSITTFDGLSGGTDRSDASVQLFESDGVTPVEISVADVPQSAPEPATFALLALGVLVGFGRRRRKLAGG